MCNYLKNYVGLASCFMVVQFAVYKLGGRELRQVPCTYGNQHNVLNDVYPDHCFSPCVNAARSVPAQDFLLDKMVLKSKIANFSQDQQYGCINKHPQP